MALVFSALIPVYYWKFCQHMAQVKLNTFQIVLMAHYKNLLIQIIHMAHICKNGMIQIKDMFQIVGFNSALKSRGHKCPVAFIEIGN